MARAITPKAIPSDSVEIVPTTELLKAKIFSFLVAGFGMENSSTNTTKGIFSLSYALKKKEKQFTCNAVRIFLNNIVYEKFSFKNSRKYLLLLFLSGAWFSECFSAAQA